MPDQSSPQFNKIICRRVPIKLKQFARLLSEIDSSEIDSVRITAMESQLRRTRETCLEFGVESTATLLGRIQAQLALDEETLNSQKPLIRRFVTRLEHHADRLQQGDVESLNHKPTQIEPKTSESAAVETPDDSSTTNSAVLPSELLNDNVSESSVEPNDTLELSASQLLDQEIVITNENHPLELDQAATSDASREIEQPDKTNIENEIPLVSDDITFTEIPSSEDLDEGESSEKYDPGFDEADFPAPPERQPSSEKLLDTEALANELDSTAAELEPIPAPVEPRVEPIEPIDAPVEPSEPELSSAVETLEQPQPQETPPAMPARHEADAYEFKESVVETSSIRDNQILQHSSEITIYWCMDDHLYFSVKQQLVSFGYHIEDSKIHDAIQSAAGNSQHVVMAKLEDFPEEQSEPINETSHLVLFSEHDTLQTRLRGIRLGSTLFFSEPIDTVKLMEYLDTFETSTDASDFHVLVMEDSKAQAKYNDKILSGAGFDTCIVMDPMELLNSLSNFEPEVILMDMQMPGCNGIELTKVLRQIEKYSTVPIVFLSAEENHEKQKEALTSGGNAFISKPVKKDQLLFMTELYARHTRNLRPHLTHDFATGLRSSSMMHEQLAIEAERSTRQNTPMFLALVEINDLSSLNSTHGYAFGDRCTQQLSRLLRQRLRKTDCIGYFDSQRIGVILNHCSDQDAESVMNYLRQTFANTPVAFEKQQIPVGLCIGLAKLGSDYNVPKLVKRAEAAITESKKHNGHNLIWAHER